MTSVEMPQGAEPSRPFAARESAVDLSVLNRVGDRVARGVREVVAGCGLAGPDVGAPAVRLESFGGWRGKLAPVCGLCRIGMPAFKSGVLVVLPARLVAQMVDGFYGGSGDVDFDRVSFTGAEDRILYRAGERFAEILAAAWAELAPGPASLLATGCDLGADHLPDGEQVAVQTFVLNGPLFAGTTIELLYPVAGLRGLKPSAATFGSQLSESADSGWKDQLIDAVLNVRFPLRTIFARADLPLNDLLNLQPGDLIPICLPNRIPVTVGGRHFAEATVGESNGRTSVRIEAMQKGPADYD